VKTIPKKDAPSKKKMIMTNPGSYQMTSDEQAITIKATNIARPISERSAGGLSYSSSGIMPILRYVPTAVNEKILSSDYVHPSGRLSSNKFYGGSE
jgi:hypothetical protein